MKIYRGHVTLVCHKICRLRLAIVKLRVKFKISSFTHSKDRKVYTKFENGEFGVVQA